MRAAEGRLRATGTLKYLFTVPGGSDGRTLSALRSTDGSYFSQELAELLAEQDLYVWDGDYYAREMLRLKDGVETYSVPGEESPYFYQPMGVGVITPWNFPIAIPCWKMMPALVTGNTVVFKPASDTPHCATLLVELIAEAPPEPFFLSVAYLAPHSGGPRESDDPANLATPVPAPRHRWVGVVIASDEDNPFSDHCLVMCHDRLVFDPSCSVVQVWWYRPKASSGSTCPTRARTRHPCPSRRPASRRSIRSSSGHGPRGRRATSDRSSASSPPPAPPCSPSASCPANTVVRRSGRFT